MTKITIHKERWEDLTAVEFELLADKSKHLYYIDSDKYYEMVVPLSLFNSLGRKLGTGQLIENNDVLRFRNGLTVVPNG